MIIAWQAIRIAHNIYDPSQPEMIDAFIKSIYRLNKYRKVRIIHIFTPAIFSCIASCGKEKKSTLYGAFAIFCPSFLMEDVCIPE